MLKLYRVEDRRSSIRRRVLRAGSIILHDDRSVYGCMLRNLSDTGALLKVESCLGIPDDFLLRFDGRHLACRVSRRTYREIGVSFRA